MTHVHIDEPQTKWRMGCVGIIEEAISNTRPGHEKWSVRMETPVDGVTRLHFSRGAEAPAAIAVVLADNLGTYRLLYSALCRFLRHKWPGAIPRAPR